MDLLIKCEEAAARKGRDRHHLLEWKLALSKDDARMQVLPALLADVFVRCVPPRLGKLHVGA